MSFLRTLAFFVVGGLLAGVLLGLILSTLFMSVQTIDFVTEDPNPQLTLTFLSLLYGAGLGLAIGTLTGLVIGWLVRRTTQLAALIGAAVAVAFVPLYIVAASLFSNPFVIPSLQSTLFIALLVNSGLAFLYHRRLEAAG